jgi:hypothetical protein
MAVIDSVAFFSYSCGKESRQGEEDPPKVTD